MGKVRARVREAPDPVEDPIPIVAEIKLEAQIGIMEEIDIKGAKALVSLKDLFNHLFNLRLL